MSLGTLCVLPSLAAARGPNGGLVVTRKFVDGMRSYVERWDGPVSAVLDVGVLTNNLDNVEVFPRGPSVRDQRGRVRDRSRV